MSNGPAEGVLMHVAAFVFMMLASVIYVRGMPVEQVVFAIGIPAIILGVWLFGVHFFTGPSRAIRQISVIVMGAGLIAFSGCFAVGAWTQFREWHVLSGLANLGIMLGLLGSVFLVTRRPHELWARKAGRWLIAAAGALAVPFVSVSVG